ncbi:hypothetical protein NIES4102_04660 [Chondrocystis sp. NIES-4102]|nr:hypothetical protein NIES4102_04660 [Chondrocystis sp. NIES-4102]
MQSKYIDHSQKTVLEIAPSNPMQLSCNPSVEQKIFVFDVSFIGQMEMYSDVDTVAEYLNAHEGWFCRCAQPMQVEPLGDNGYVLTIGKFGSFGYEVEPKIGVVLMPPVGRVYDMHTIPVPNYESVGYEVNYRASMGLTQINLDQPEVVKQGLFNKNQITINCITQVAWTLDLTVKVEFPQFIYKLSPSLIQSTGDRVLAQIVRQISPRLTYKVQQDFHTSRNLPIPPKSSRHLNQVNKSSL